MKVNYQIEMERELERIAGRGHAPRLLLHSCCAPCSSYVLEALNRCFDIDVYYYNPNIAPPGGVRPPGGGASAAGGAPAP